MTKLVIKNLRMVYNVAQLIAKERNISLNKMNIHNNLTEGEIKTINDKLCNFIKTPYLSYLSKDDVNK